MLVRRDNTSDHVCEDDGNRVQLRMHRVVGLSDSGVHRHEQSCRELASGRATAGLENAAVQITCLRTMVSQFSAETDSGLERKRIRAIRPLLPID